MTTTSFASSAFVPSTAMPSTCISTSARGSRMHFLQERRVVKLLGSLFPHPRQKRQKSCRSEKKSPNYGRACVFGGRAVSGTTPAWKKLLPLKPEQGSQE